MKKGQWFILVSSLAIILVFILVSCSRISYSSFGEAYKNSENIFNDKKSEFLIAVKKIARDESIDGTNIKGVERIDYVKNESIYYIKFEIGASGMLGGQYWCIYFISDNQPLGELAETELIEGPEKGCYFQLEQNGNNFYAIKKNEKNRFFAYWDFDGKQKSA